MDTHRESCQRQHRVLGHFLAIQAWLQGLDCIVLERAELEEYLGLERFKSERIKWLIEDLKPWFPYSSEFYKTKSPSSLHSLFVSRVMFGNWFPVEPMTTFKRISKISADKSAPRVARIKSKLNGGGKVREIDIVRYLAVLSSGLESPEVLLSTA